MTSFSRTRTGADRRAPWRPARGAVAAWLVAVAVPVWAASAAAADSPHEITATPPSGACTECHNTQPAVAPGAAGTAELPQPGDYRQDGIAMCTGCHGDEEDSHPLGGQPDFTVPADLPLGMDGEITCLTCHYVHGSLTCDQPRASVSVMDRMFDSERLHRSYLLRRANHDGDLCNACHHP